jgi:hypothetical protein
MDAALIKNVPGSTIYTVKSLILEIIASLEKASILTKFYLPIPSFEEQIKILENWQEKLLWECRECVSSFARLRDTLQDSVQEFRSLCKNWNLFEAKVSL